MFTPPLYTQNRFYGATGVVPFVGPLDGLAAPDVAFSLNRRLLAAYTGSLFRVRRSSDSTTLDIGADENGDVDVAALTAFCGAGNGFVTIVYDQSGNGRNLTNGASDTHPQIVASGTPVDFGTTGGIAAECVGGLNYLGYTFTSLQTPSAMSYAAALVHVASGDYHGQCGNPGAVWDVNGCILLWGASNTSIQNFTAIGARGNALTVIQGGDTIAGVEVGPTNVTHYLKGVANTPGAYSPTFSFQTFTLATLGIRFAENVLWLSAQGSAVAAFGANQAIYFGL